MTRYTASRTQAALAFYYFDFTNDVKTKTLSCLRSIILQLAEQTADTTSLQALQRTYAMGTPPIQEFSDVLKSILCEHNRVYIVVDALDECTDQEELFDLLNSIRDWELESLSILVTSRDEPDIRECLHPAPEQEIRLRNSAIDNDLRLFIVETLQKDKKLQVWSDIFPEIEAALTHGAHGMFRWVDCQLQTLRRCPSLAEVRKALKNLPETLDKTYERMLNNIHPSLRDYALRLLQWLCIADGAVYMEHIMDAFATNIGKEPRFDREARFVSPDKVLALCPGLIIKSGFRWEFWGTSQKCVQIAHYSVKEYLVSNRLPMAPNPLCMFRIQQPLANLAMAKTCLVYAIFAPHEPHDLRESMASFMQSARMQWPRFFSNAKSDSQLLELATSYLTQEKGYTLDGDINAAMEFAIKHHFRDIETWLADHHRPSIDPNLALLANCKEGDVHSLDFVGFWIKQGADVSAAYVKELTIYDDRNRLYRKLTLRGSTPLHIAAFRSSVALAQLLLKNGASLKAENNDGLTPLEVAFEEPSCLNLDLIKLLWFDDARNRLDLRERNFLHRVAETKCQQRDQMDGLGINEVVMEETISWLISHGVDPLSKDRGGELPFHKAAMSDNSTAMKALHAATGRSSEYQGCLIAFLEDLRLGKCTLSTAQLLLEIDPDPFRRFPDGSGLLPFVLHDAVDYAKPTDRNDPDLGLEFTALFLKYEKDPAHTKMDLYISFLEIILEDCSSDVSTIVRWLAMELVKRRGLDFLGIDVWSGALTLVSHSLIHEITRGKTEKTIHSLFLQIQEMFEKREIFGIGIKELYRLLLCTLLDRGPLAKLIISQEPAYTALGLSDEIPSIPWSKGRRRTLGYSFVSLMVHREIHSDTQNKDDDAVLLDAIKHDLFEIVPVQTTHLLMERLLLKRAGDINHQTQEGLTLLAGCIAYLSSWQIEETGLLKSCLYGGCDANIQDHAGRTPLMIAAYRGVSQTIEVLLNAGCDANLQDWEGGTPVTDIVVDEEFFIKMTQNLWKKRFSPVGGHTALMYAVIVGKTSIVRLLLKNGCDTELKNNQGRTALDLARQFDEIEIVEILECHEVSEQSNYREYAQSNYEEYEQTTP